MCLWSIFYFILFHFIFIYTFYGPYFKQSDYSKKAFSLCFHCETGGQMCRNALPLHALTIQRGRKVKRRSLSVARPSSIRHCYFILTYVSILSPSLWSIFLTWYYITAHMGERTPKNSTMIVFWKDEMKPAAWKSPSSFKLWFFPERFQITPVQQCFCN